MSRSLSNINNWIKKHPFSFIAGGVIFDSRSNILGTPIEIKHGTHIDGFVSSQGNAHITIGKYCHIDKNLYIISSYQPINKNYFVGLKKIWSNKEGEVYIGNNVIIGKDIVILPGVKIGDGAIIMDNSVITENIRPFSIVGGSPAKFMRYRFSQKIIEQLIRCAWWHYDENIIQKNKDKFLPVIGINETLVNQFIEGFNSFEDEELTKIDFNEDYSCNYILDGWGQKEREFRWIQQKEAGMIFKVRNIQKYKYLFFKGYSYFESQKLTINMNGTSSINLKILNNLNEYKIPIQDLKKGVNKIRILSSRGIKPCEIEKKSNDKRKLYCCFYSIELLEQ